MPSEARGRVISTLITSLTADGRPDSEHTLSHVSTITDIWIALGYNVRGDERNRQPG
ncbi:MAG: hypothetical protein U5K33_06825 [Halofilum sp. (in: g-proteobacteria)]|nr:hypothetical protein [Halofilum sp. (in: g-proteobacteria)]